jgi:hypothetical protein
VHAVERRHLARERGVGLEALVRHVAHGPARRADADARLRPGGKELGGAGRLQVLQHRVADPLPPKPRRPTSNAAAFTAKRTRAGWKRSTVARPRPVRRSA